MAPDPGIPRPVRSAPARPSVRLALALTLACAAACSNERPTPNVILISVDTLRADRTTPYGHVRDTTPALARLAAEGTLFERAYAMSSWTLPSMSMLMTGEFKPLADQAILPAHESVGESFKKAGYRTAGVAANPLLSEEVGYDKGLDFFVCSPPEDAIRWPARRVFDAGLGWLEDTDESGLPYFLWLHPTDPHAPYAPEDGIAFHEPIDGEEERALALRSLEPQFAGGVARANPELLTDKAWRRIRTQRDLYDSDVLQFDRQLQRLIDLLEERGELDSTIIVVTSDHGEGLWQRAANPDEKDQNIVFPGLYDSHGAQLYEEQIRVPLVFRGPGVPRGVRVPEPVDLVDVTPSLLALADVPVSRMYDGTPLFDGGRVDLPDQDVIISVCSRLRTITLDGRWRLYEPREYRINKELVEVRLYDLENDPLELSPIDDPALTADLRARLAAWHEEHAPEGISHDTMTPERMRLLFSLGYGGETQHVIQFRESLERQAAEEAAAAKAASGVEEEPDAEGAGG
ncbi:MAG: sulfatase [Planctomycetota bacterium]